MSHPPCNVRRMGSRDDRIAAARISGMAAGWVAGNGDYVHIDEPTIIGMITAVSADPHILNHAAAGFTIHDRDRPTLDLLVRCGADEGQARQIMARRGPGWRTPQAERWQPADQPGRDGDGAVDG